MSQTFERCVYCLDAKMSVAICAECQRRLDRAERELKAARESAEGWKRLYYRILNAQNRAFRKEIRR